MLQYYTLKDIGDIFASVGGVFQVLIDFTPFNYIACVKLADFK